MDDAVKMASQLDTLLNRTIDLKVFMDSRPLLESIRSLSQVTEKALSQFVAYLKQGLEDKEVHSYG